jgi:hypothetical protein
MPPTTLLLLFLALLAGALGASSPTSFDVLVYGSTPGGVIAAVAAGRSGASTLLLDPAPRLGGMCTGGLGATDKGNTFAIGGYANEFFVRVAKHYNGSATSPEFYLEPHVAQQAFMDMLADANVTWVQTSPLGLASVSRSGTTVTGLTTAGPSPTTYSASYFIDGTYEGDFLAMAGATMAVGRESTATYGESFAGRREPYSAMDWAAVNPYVNSTTNSGGVLSPLITDAYAQPFGSGDGDVMDFNFRLCVTKSASNGLPFPAPSAYNASDWELLRRYAAVAPPTLGSYLNNIQPLPSGKFDMNNGGLISTDCAGCSWKWPNATPAERQTIWEQHKEYTLSFFHFLLTDPAVPAAVKSAFGEYRLCADEFNATGGWPEQLYVREGRRLVGDDIFTQNDVGDTHSFGNSTIFLGSYAFDGHYSHRGPCIPNPGGKGCTMWTSPNPPPPGTDVWVGGEGYPGPQTNLYQVPHTILMPRRAELTNAMAVTTPSASHVAFASLRMEPQFMVAGQAAGDIAGLLVEAGGRGAVQDVDLDVLHAKLAAEGAVLCHEAYPKC